MTENPLTFLITAALVTAVLCMVFVKASWLIWMPILLAIGVVGYLAIAIRPKL